MGQELVGRLMADMNPELLEFLRANVDSFVKWDLIRYFYENPHGADTAENVAWYAGRNAETMRAELSELVAKGVLVQEQQGDVTFYSLSNSRVVRDLVRRFVEASDDRRFRVKAVYHILRSMR